MLVIVLENVPSRLRGYLSRLFLEIRAGVFVGNYSTRVRERVWAVVEKGVGEGNAVLAWTAPNDAGFDFETCGTNRRVPVLLDGLKLCAFRPPIDPEDNAGGSEPEPQVKVHPKSGRFIDNNIKA
ncbi:MAG: type I-E CRISPR-associated endoribonuclease Cas2e [Holophaga sp.]|nr:type I-E CRISPR-associated endoribonuclease Cas2e [Holophaga sp.]